MTSVPEGAEPSGAAPSGLYYEDFAEGERWRSRGRTVTEADVAQFAGLSWDYTPLHTDEEYCRQHSVFGTRVAHGLLGLAMASGLMVSLGLTEGTILALLGLEWRFLGPIKIGATIHVRQRLVSRRETSKPDRGILVFDTDLRNQRGEVVQQGTRTVLVKRRPPTLGAAEGVARGRR